MLVLLPPSESKAQGGDGPPLSSVGLGPPSLAPARAAVLEAVARMCRDDPPAAAAALKLPSGLAAAALAANVAALDAPTMPALDRFTGVLYEGLDVGTLTPAQRTTADGVLVILNGAFGALQAGEPLPDHRVPASAVLPGLGSVTAWWRTVLRGYLPMLVGHQPVLDLRSTDYAAMWPVTGPLRRQVIPVRILTAKGRGRSEVRRALSYQAKVGKGRLVRALLTSSVVTQGHESSVTPARLAHAVADVAADLGYRAEVKHGAADQLTLDLVGRV